MINNGRERSWVARTSRAMTILFCVPPMLTALTSLRYVSVDTMETPDATDRHPGRRDAAGRARRTRRQCRLYRADHPQRRRQAVGHRDLVPHRRADLGPAAGSLHPDG